MGKLIFLRDEDTSVNSLESISSILNFENGLRVDDGVVKLGLDITTVGTTNEGLLTEPTYLAYTDDSGLQIGPINNTGGAGLGTYSNLIALIGYSVSLGSTRSIGIDPSGMFVLDNVASKGLEYSADYSSIGSLYDRWIPDYGAVKSLVESSSLTFENGLREEDGVVKLGLDLTTLGTTNIGSLTEDTILVRGNYLTNSASVIIGSPQEGNYSAGIAVGSIPTGGHGADIDIQYYSDTDNPTLYISRVNSSGTQRISLDMDGMRLTDSFTQKGFQYEDDYSTVGSLDDRWIPDYGAVKNYADEAISQLTDYNTLLFSDSLTSISDEYINTGDWSVSANGITSTATGLANYITLNRQYGLDRRIFSFDIKMGEDTRFMVLNRMIEVAAAIGSIFELDASDNKIRMYAPYNGTTTLPAVFVETDYAFNTDTEYHVDILRYKYTNEIIITDKQTAISFSLIDDTKSTGIQEDAYSFVTFDGTHPTVRNISIKAKAPINSKLVILGDSITWGVGVPEYKDRYSDKLISRIGNNGDLSGRPSGVVQGVLNRIQTEAKYLKPDFVMVCIGTNGGNTQSNLTDIVNSIISIGAIPILNNIVWKNNDASFTNTTNTDIAAVRTSKNIHGALWDVATSLDYLNEEQDMSVYDGLVHPNPEGHQRMYDRILLDLPELLSSDSYQGIIGDVLHIGARYKGGVNYNNITTTTPIALQRFDNSNNGASFIALKGKGTLDSPLPADANNVVTSLEGVYYDGTNTYSPSVGIRMLSTQTHSPTSKGTWISFMTTPDDTILADGYRHRMMLWSDGSLRINGNGTYIQPFLNPGSVAVKDVTDGYNGLSFHETASGNRLGGIYRIPGAIQYDYNTGGAHIFSINESELLRINNSGIQYADDYSADYTDRSIPDYGAVKKYTDITPTKNITTTTYTLVAEDAHKWLVFSNAATQTITVPPSIFPEGVSIKGVQRGAGQVVFVAGSGITLLTAIGEDTAIAEQGGVFELHYESATNVALFGRLVLV